jgi:putative nucleotidyltransferase with HDIG domain
LTQKERILVIDDEDFILQLARDILTKTDYEVKTVSDGNEGIRLLESRKFDLLLTDIRMPDISGLDVIKHVRTGNKEIPIIIITGHGTLETAVDALRLGAQGFILKPFTPVELRTAVADALEKTRLLKENIKLRTLMPLFEFSREIISETDPRRLLKLIVEIALKETRADAACICLMDEETEKFELCEERGMSPDMIRHFMDKEVHKVAKLVSGDKKALLFDPGAKLPHGLKEMVQAGDKGQRVYVPLIIRDHISGILFASRMSSEHSFSPSEVEFISVLSGQAAAAIENARLYEKLKRSYLSMIVTLSGVVEARDSNTDKHMKDIAEYSVAISQRLNLDNEETENIRRAALLHDLGKICVPDHILMKPDKLSDEEMDIIKKHPLDGAKILEAVEPIRDAKHIIRHHHEFFDGSGYPDGLKGETIPLGARIIAVADAFGAMTTDRPYRNALSTAEAVKELKQFSGIQFDPRIVEIFISVLRTKGIMGDD